MVMLVRVGVRVREEIPLRGEGGRTTMYVSVYDINKYFLKNNIYIYMYI